MNQFEELIKDFDHLLNKYGISIYEAMKIYERNQMKPTVLIQCYDDFEKKERPCSFWQYYTDENICFCGCNCYHLEYHRTDGNIYGVCNSCDRKIYIINEEYKDIKLKQGQWVPLDFLLYRKIKGDNNNNDNTGSERRNTYNK